VAIHYEIEAGVAVATIDHPPSNLVDGAFFLRLLDVLEALEADPSVRVLVFKSADPEFFIMHGDVDMLRELSPPYTEATEPNIAAATFTRLRAGRLVTIGLLDGQARGGGCELLCGLDLRFGSERSVVGQPEVALGILAGAGGTVRWPQMVGRGRALDILLTGRDVTADELYAIGWLDRLVPSAELEPTGLAVARRIAAMPANAVAAVKRVVDAPDEEALTIESDQVARLLASGNHHDRMAQFLAAGGQDRDAETTHMQAILDDVLGI
jgi:enoyl-CoA hydratase/carnithine racemase